MIGLQDFQNIIANTLFDGSMEIAGMVMFSVVVAMVFSVVKKTFLVLIMMIPITLIFSYLDILNMDLTVILLLITVMGLAVTAPRALR